MRNRATFILAAAALVQTALLVGALAVLVFRLREVRADLTRQETGERLFQDELADVERGMYRTSILLRDYILVTRDEQPAVRQELYDTLKALAAHPIRPPDSVSASVHSAVAAAEAARREFLDRAILLSALEEKERRALGPRYVPRQLSPLREKFAVAARELDTLVRSLRESRNQDMAASLRVIQTSTLRILSGAAGLGLALAAVAIWRFRHYERERDIHLRHLEDAEEGLRALSQNLVDSQETERKRIARELHDEVGQNLTALRVQLGQVAVNDPDSRTHLAQAGELADRSLRTVREIARGLRPAMLDELGLGPALQWLGRDLSKHTVLDVEVQVEGAWNELDEAQRTCLYRVAQESLTNCVKHSEASSARVSLEGGVDEVILTIQDRGAGFRPGDGPGIGLLGMRERVEELGGEFNVESSPQTGTLIRAILPKEKRSKHDTHFARG